ncbi:MULTISPECIES: MT-A70 family methyltransferase [unclassified Bradyrhizobium]|uniref:MT-A70 family methyltransferase n=1 Tax=unclassified Bradyrhizobium TaxID=2631580 RepID=UPI002915C56A|nr:MULTISPECIES: MT-A70 family methyltransferase [unclassified Bradyrhizobium]
MTPLSFHPYADLFPLIEGQEFYDLAEDIRVNGLHDKIDLIEINGANQILDGRNRYRAIVWIMSTGEALGPGWGIHAGRALSPADLMSEDQPWRSWLYQDGDANDYGSDLLAYVLSKNLKRRQLDESQRAIIAGRLANMRQGQRTDLEPSANLQKVSTAAAAEAVNVSERSAAAGRKVVQSALPEVVAAVERGQIKVSVAEQIAAQPAERQAEIVAALPRDAEGRLTPEVKKALAPVIKEIRKEKIAAKKEQRAEREAKLGRKIQALPEKMFGVAIEDFEWDHETWSAETGTERHPSMHYETATDAHTPEEVVARCAERFACLADDCILFKWTTGPHAYIAMRTMELQGFKYVSQLVWNKERPGNARGPGYWVTGEHEIVLIGTRGKVVPPATAHFRSNFSAPVTDHSEKPNNIHEMIEFHWPNVPKVEFNARRRRPGWEAWGFDAPAIPAEPELSGDAPAQGEALSQARRLPPSDDPILLEWKALSAIDAGIVVTGLAVEGLIRDGWVVRDIDETLVVTDEGIERMRALDAEFIPTANSQFADSGQSLRAADLPAPPASPPAPEDGIVEPARVDQDTGAETAVPPAGRPGSNSPGSGFPDLEIPPFLRRTSSQTAAEQSEMDLARRDRLPREVVDGHLQTRLPLTLDELEMQAALRAIDAGEAVEWSITRHLIGAGFAHATTKRLLVTDEGRDFLAQLVQPALAAAAEVRP